MTYCFRVEEDLNVPNHYWIRPKNVSEPVVYLIHDLIEAVQNPAYQDFTLLLGDSMTSALVGKGRFEIDVRNRTIKFSPESDTTKVPAIRRGLEQDLKDLGFNFITNDLSAAASRAT